MYNLGDLSYKLQPKFLSRENISLLAERIREYCLSEGKHSFEVIIHGGEPLLMGVKYFDYFLQEIERILMPDISPVFSVQTNGILLNDKWLQLFIKHDVALSVSLDGNRAINDLYRVDHAGKSTYEAALSGISSALKLFDPQRQIGVLAVMTPKSNPGECYNFFKDLKIKNLDFLFPHHNYDNPPKKENEELAYSDWWIELFRQWYYDRDPEKPNIRFLTQIIVTILGCNVGFDMLGNLTSDYLIIETDGSIETVDGLKSCGDGFTKEGVHLKSHPLMEAIEAPLIRLYHESHTDLPDICSVCQIKEICGGGFLAHRYSTEKGFNNPSVYCHDLIKIISRIQNIVISDLSESTRVAAGLEAIDPEEIFKDLN